MVDKEIRKRVCSLNGCTFPLDYRQCLEQFSKNWNELIRKKEMPNIKKKFNEIWNSEYVSMFCCTHYKMIKRAIKEQTKNTRLINKARKIREKHKLKLKQCNNNEKNKLDFFI